MVLELLLLQDQALRSPLHAAAFLGDVRIMDLLIKSGTTPTPDIRTDVLSGVTFLVFICPVLAIASDSFSWLLNLLLNPTPLIKMFCSALISSCSVPVSSPDLSCFHPAAPMLQNLSHFTKLMFLFSAQSLDT